MSIDIIQFTEPTLIRFTTKMDYSPGDRLVLREKLALINVPNREGWYYASEFAEIFALGS